MSPISCNPLVCHQCVQGGIGLPTADQTWQDTVVAVQVRQVLCDVKLSEGVKEKNIQTDAMAFPLTVKF